MGDKVHIELVTCFIAQMSLSMGEEGKDLEFEHCMYKQNVTIHLLTVLAILKLTGTYNLKNENFFFFFYTFMSMKS